MSQKSFLFIVVAPVLFLFVSTTVHAQELPQEENFSLSDSVQQEEILRPLVEQPSVQMFQDPYEESVGVWTKMDIHAFQPLEGDYFMANLTDSIGYLVNDHTKTYASFPILSGRRRWVHYVGSSYFAGTPEQTWYAKEADILGDRVTFSKSGRFLRLYENDGTKYTHYGIHSHKYFDVMINRPNKYVSYGCILVADDVLDVVEKSFQADNGSLKVVSTTDVSKFDFLKEKRMLTFVN